MLGDLAESLRAEAKRVNERRLVVLAGAHDACLESTTDLLSGADLMGEAITFVGRADLALETVAPERAATLLGTSRDAVVVDGHAGLDPNVIGRVVGTVTGGGLVVLLTPPLDEWPERRDSFDESLAVPPFDLSAVSGNFRRWFVSCLRSHEGIAIVDVDSGTIERDGQTDPPPRNSAPTPSVPADHEFPAAAYEACLTPDQVHALQAFESLRGSGTAVVVEADRGRGKSSAAGLAAASLAIAGGDVTVTAPEFRSAAAVFARAEELLDRLDQLSPANPARETELRSSAGGRIQYRKPDAAEPAASDVLIVDEAAAISVPLLTEFLAADRVAFTTTIHGYEGAGRGFSVRFRDRLGASDHTVVDVTMAEPIRYAPGDPVEVWSFRALLLDATPPPAELVDDAEPDTTKYCSLAPETLIENESRLREAFGLLVLGHYRTEPADLARLLDAPNVVVRALLHDGHVVSVALLAREGNLPPDLRAAMYEGARVRGNMLPDILTSQLRDEDAAQPEGLRVMRIATHDAVRSRGLGSTLLEGIHGEFANDVDWFGAGFGATRRLLEFWRFNGYSTVHLSTTRNETSGEYSAIMLRPITADGRALHDRHAAWFARRLPAVLSDALADIDPDIARAACRAVAVDVDVELTEAEWQLVASAAYGPGLVDIDPGPFRELARKHLIDPDDPDLLTPEHERLLVRKVLQAAPWSAVSDELGYPSPRQCMRALGTAYQPLVDHYGTRAAHDDRDRFQGSDHA